MATNYNVLLLLTIVSCTRAWPTTSSSLPSNGTITDGSNGSNVWCEPTHWYDILWFFFANYLLHALSVRSLPGESPLSSTVFKFCCLLVPYTGVRRGLCLILRASNLAGNDLQAAARANALCMVIRSPEWRPKDGQVIEGCEIKAAEKTARKRKWSERLLCRSTVTAPEEKSFEMEISTCDSNASAATGVLTRAIDEVTLKTTDIYSPPASRHKMDKITKALIESHRFHSLPPTENIVDHANFKIHGVCQLAPGYALGFVPKDIKIYSHVKHQRSLSLSRVLGMNHTPQVKLASTHDVPRILFSIIQTISGGYSLYKARGAQIERYGFAAYGLTVLPYMMVSIINLIGSLLTSEYETMYLVHSAIMDEMKDRGGICDGVVGTLEKPACETYQYIDGEIETAVKGFKVQFTNTAGTVQVQDLAKDASHEPLRVSDRNYIKPVKDVWLAQKWGRNWRKKKEGLKSESCGFMLNIPSHAPFTRLPPAWYQTYLNMLTMVLLLLALGAPYLVTAILTHYRVGRSSSTERTFMLNWLICGQFQGYAVSHMEAVNGKKTMLKTFLLVFVTYGSYCFMGLYATAAEMIESGTCKAL